MALKDARASKKMTQEMQYFCNITHIVFVPYRSHKFFSFFFAVFLALFFAICKKYR